MALQSVLRKLPHGAMAHYLSDISYPTATSVVTYLHPWYWQVMHLEWNGFLSAAIFCSMGYTVRLQAGHLGAAPHLDMAANNIRVSGGKEHY